MTSGSTVDPAGAHRAPPYMWVLPSLTAEPGVSVFNEDGGVVLRVCAHAQLGVDQG